MYDKFVPTYFNTASERKNSLQSLKIPSKVCRESMLLFQDKTTVYKNSFDRRENKLNTLLKWKEAENTELYSIKNGEKEDFQFKEDWAKTIHLIGNKFFVTGGSNEINNRQLPFYMRRQYYSKAAHIIDT